MANERIKLHDTTQEIVMKMCEGNPGGLRVLVDMIKNGSAIDPNDIMQGLGGVLALDSNNIYGSRIWYLYKDVCKGNLSHMIAVLRGWQLGYVTENLLAHAIDNYGDGLNVDSIVAQVQKRLPDFKVS